MSRVLLVEDEPLIAWMISDWLSERGCEIIAMPLTSRDALRAVDSGTPDIALVDFMLGDGPAHSLIAYLTARRIPFLLISGHQLEGEELAGIECLSKPVDFDQLGEAMLRTLARAKAIGGALDAAKAMPQPDPPMRCRA